MSQNPYFGSETLQPAPTTSPVTGRHKCGFSLIELMVTLAVAAVLMAVAAPSFTNITVSNKLTTTANEVVGAINLARTEAIKRNASTQVCSNSATNNGTDALGVACTTQAGAVYQMISDCSINELQSISKNLWYFVF